MKLKTKYWLLLLASTALAFWPLLLTAQTAEPTPPAPAPTEESVLALLKATGLQIVNSQASIFVIIALSIVSAVIEIFIRAIDWLSNKIITPSILMLCTFGGAVCYWLFSSTKSVPEHFPHPHAVLVVSGLVCGLVAFVLHMALVRFLISKINTEPKPPEHPKP